MRNTLKQKGFTLIELVVVIVLIAVLAAIMAPRQTDLKSAAQSASFKASADAVRTAWKFQFLKQKGAPTLQQLAGAVEIPSGSGIATPSSSGNGVCIGQGAIVLTYSDENSTIPTVVPTDKVLGIAFEGVEDSGCP